MSNFVKLKEHAKVITGFPFKGNQYSDSGIKTVRGENVTEGKLRWDTIKCWNQKFEKQENYLLKPNDIVIGMDGSKVGKNKARVKQKDLPLLLAQRVACVRVKKGNDQVFFYYLINNPRFERYVFKTQTGSSVPHISKAQIEDFQIPKFDINDQQKIASVLSALDDKIELNNRINAELEQMAKLLYEYWFVQFDFPYDLRQSKPADETSKPQDIKPYKSSGGKMVWNKDLNREIPEGWEVKKLHQVAKIVMGQSPLGESYNENAEGMIFFQGSTDFGWRFPKNRVYTTSPTRFSSQGDILLSVRAPIGTMNLALRDCCIGRGLAALNSKEGYNSFLIYQMTNFKKKFDYLNSVGTTFGSLTKDDLYNLELSYPESSLLRNFENTVSAFDRKIEINALENQELSSLRDWLLPMLMNGQISVMDAEERVSEELGMVAEGERGRYEKK
jgi:type I restriction enzyme S subunit